MLDHNAKKIQKDKIIYTHTQYRNLTSLCTEFSLLPFCLEHVITVSHSLLNNYDVWEYAKYEASSPHTHTVHSLSM